LPGGGCLVYSPVLGPDSKIESVKAALEKMRLLPVRIVVAPTPQHHLSLAEYQRVFPEAFYLCGRASGQMQPLTKKRRDVRWDGNLRPPGRVCDGVSSQSHPESASSAPLLDESEIASNPLHPIGGGYAKLVDLWSALTVTPDTSVFDACVLDDNRTGEVVLLHRPSKTLLISDLLYKSCRSIVGPGGVDHNYSTPEWFAKGQEELFYDPRCNIEGQASAMDDGASPGRRSRLEPCTPLLPAYRTHPKARTVDVYGLRLSLDRVLAWDFTRCLACHTDPLDGDEARILIKQAWGWVWEC